VGSHLCSDAATSKPIHDRTFGHFVSVIIDLATKLKYKVLVERNGYFFLLLDYDNLSAFSNNSKMVGITLRNL
jgi:hypothetical protein